MKLIFRARSPYVLDEGWRHRKLRGVSLEGYGDIEVEGCTVTLRLTDPARAEPLLQQLRLHLPDDGAWQIWQVEDDVVLRCGDKVPLRPVRVEDSQETPALCIERTADEPAQTRVFDDGYEHLFTLSGHLDTALCREIVMIKRDGVELGIGLGRSRLARNLRALLGAAAEGHDHADDD